MQFWILNLFQLYGRHALLVVALKLNTYYDAKVMKGTCGAYIKGRFIRSNFGPIIISIFFVHDEKCWRSHNPIFPSNYFVMYSRETRQFLFSPQLGPAVAAIL